jgi:3-oxoacyl-[acyl-carrier-protein] synthase-3
VRRPEVLEAAHRNGHGAARPRAGIAGLGYALPETEVATSAIAARVGVEPDWITRRTGIATRRRAAVGESVTGLAARAARAGLADAGVEPGALDALIVATTYADDPLPNAAPLVARELGIAGVACWDVGLACSGSLAALHQAAALVESGRAQRVLVIGAEVLSRVTDHDDRATAGLFGDGAGAALVTARGRMRIGEAVIGVDRDDPHQLALTRADPLIRMDGPRVFQRAVACMDRACREVLVRAGLTIDDVDLLVPHQANARITRALADRFGLPDHVVVDAIADVGNTGGASIPITLARAAADGRVPDEGIVLLAAFGAGFAYGAMLLELGEEG